MENWIWYGIGGLFIGILLGASMCCRLSANKNKQTEKIPESKKQDFEKDSLCESDRQFMA